MSEVKIVGRGVDTLVLNVCYSHERLQPLKRVNLVQTLEKLDPKIIEQARMRFLFSSCFWASGDLVRMLSPGEYISKPM